ncbi:hypothetical protein CHU98_g8394 [Xylaria longipes]|nr:hypothetical protein CHU98_g8394 [Xylaria longipes]
MTSRFHSGRVPYRESIVEFGILAQHHFTCPIYDAFFNSIRSITNLDNTLEVYRSSDGRCLWSSYAQRNLRSSTTRSDESFLLASRRVYDCLGSDNVPESPMSLRHRGPRILYHAFLYNRETYNSEESTEAMNHNIESDFDAIVITLADTSLKLKTIQQLIREFGASGRETRLSNLPNNLELHDSLKLPPEAQLTSDKTKSGNISVSGARRTFRDPVVDLQELGSRGAWGRDVLWDNGSISRKLRFTI